MTYHRRMLLSLMALTLGLAACEDEEMFVAELNSANEVPPAPNPTTATGTATFTLIDNTSLTFDLTVNDIDSVTAAHIHTGTAAEAGGVIVNLFGGPTTGRDFSGTLASGTITASNTSTISFDSMMVRMRNGSLYVNVHTRRNGGGEIRGQIQAK